MRTLLLLLGASILTVGCGRKSAPVADAPAPKSPAVAERPPVVPRPQQPDAPRPAPRERPKPVDENTVADFGGGAKDVTPVEIPQPRPEPKPPSPKPPAMEEEEEPRPPKKPTPVKPAEQPKPQPMIPKPPGGNRIEAQPQQQPPAPVTPRRAVAAQDMKDIHLFVDTASLASGKMPDAVLIQAALGAAGSPAAKLVASGDIVLTGARQRESCWAYQKGATTEGGWVLTNNGAEQVDADTAKRLLGGR